MNIQQIMRFMLIALLCSCAGKTSHQTKAWLEKDELTVVVTDSGLGGISVVAELEKRFAENRHFKKVHLVFFNALFSATGGYNSLTSRDEKISYFDKALFSMNRLYQPDHILVACNTLSVLLPETRFARQKNTPTHSIIDPGVELLKEVLSQSETSKVYLFATQTTVEENSHRAAIEQLGLDPGRIVTQECPELADSIERGFHSEDTELLIMTFVDEALTASDPAKSEVYISLNCSHYPFARPLWQNSFRDYDIQPKAVLNPNLAMTQALMQPIALDRFPETEVRVSVVSMVEIPDAKRKSIAKAVENMSRPTANALLNYEHKQGLF
ncbi:MAG: hypothetical protein CSA81_06535 [Acidobacteria bacterium]|nr:MAG: hypothetical protein CSA81_06535 [Acidobacteriota bacterium]